MVLSTLREHQLYAKLSKYDFWLPEVKFLGHVVFVEGISVDITKVEALSAWEQPKSVLEIRSLFSLAGYYQRFMKKKIRVFLHR